MEANDILKSNEINQFDSNFLHYLCSRSSLYCHPSSNRIQDDEYSQCKDAFLELQRFVLGAEILNTESSVTNSVCGKLFKSREPVYICRDCATDSTCVFCRICFVKSEHIKHNYQMFSSNGGGYCDCGDVEAWKSFPRCNLHGGNSETISKSPIENYDCIEDVERAVSTISDDVKLRFLLLTKEIFDNFKYFIMRPLCKDNEELRRSELERELEFVRAKCPDTDVEEYALVLYNNEIHNFDQVINLFKRCLSCSAEQAMEYANIVDRDGRCVALVMNIFKDIEDKQQDILVRSKTQTKVELLCRLQHPLVLSIQSFIMHSLRWLYDFANQYTSLRLLLCQYMFNDVRLNDGRVFPRSNFIQDVFENHTETWKMARSSTANFLMTAVMKELYFKRMFAVEFVKSYKEIIEHYSVDDHNIQDSLISLSCQIFTIISLAKYLLENNNVLKTVIQLAYDELLKHSKPLISDGIEYSDIMIFHKDENELHKKFDSFERHLKSLGDVNYLLTSLMTSFTGYEGDENNESTNNCVQQWSEQSINSFMEYFGIFSEILSLIQETNTIERIIEHHIEHDPQWRTGIILMYDLVPCITLTCNLVTSNTKCWDLAFDICRKVIKKRLINFESKKRTIFEYCNYRATVIENNWPNKFVSVIKPLHRFMSSLLLSARYINQLTEPEVDCLFDQALQMVVFTSQQAGNMWIRNGSVPYILTQQMKCLTLSSEMYDRDVQLIQQLAISISPEEFIVKCIHKFDLKHYFLSSHGVLSEKKSLIQRVEDFLHLLIMTLFFRHRPGVGKNVTREVCYEDIILHILCVKPMTHSKIMKKLPLSLQKYPKSKLMEMIDKVADQTKQSQIVIFSAKSSYIKSNFDRFSLYYSIQDRNEAELYVQNVMKKEGSSVPLIPPEPIQLSEDFSKLYGYLSDPCFLKLLDRILLFCNEKRNSEYWTDTMLDMILYLIGASLMEDTKVLNLPKEDRRPMFLETAINPTLNIQIIDNLELLCDKITSDQQLDLIKWTIRKWHSLKKILNSEQLSFNDSIGQDYPDNANIKTEMETEIANPMLKTKLVKADAAKRRREQLMNKMKNMQKKFINENVDLLTENLEHQNYEGAQQSSVGSPQNYLSDLTCILCQEKSESNYDRPIVAIAGAWRSTVLAKHPFTSQVLSNRETSEDSVPFVPMNTSDEIDSTGLVRESVSYEDTDLGSDIDRVVSKLVLPILDHPEETFITTCGHVMHYDCKTRYMSNMIKQKQNIARTKGVLYPRIYNRCPLCKCVCNIDIPIIMDSPDNNNTLAVDRPATMSFNDWIAYFVSWVQTTTECKKADRPVRWWDKLGNQLTNFMKMTNIYKRNDSQASDVELLSCLAFRVGLAMKLQPRKLTKETYMKYETVSNSISDSSLQDIIELDYAVAYTISVWEQIMSKQGMSLLTGMPERHLAGLTHLIRAVRRTHELFAEKDSFRWNCQQFLFLLQQMLFDCGGPSMHKVWAELHNCQAPLFILEIDFAYVLTSLLFMRRSFGGDRRAESPGLNAFLDERTFSLYCVRLVYQLASVQALLGLDLARVDNVEVTFRQLMDDGPDIWGCGVPNNLAEVREALATALPSLNMPPMTVAEVAVCFSRALMPFLRVAAFLLTALGLIPPQTVGLDDGATEFNRLLRAMGLSVGAELVATDLPANVRAHLSLLAEALHGGALHGSALTTVWGTVLPHPLPTAPPTLVDLPLDFTDIITLCLDRGCSLRQQATGAVTEITLCLICGDTFCLNGYCCRRPEDSSLNVLSGAQIHARQCHGGYSLFLNTRNSKIVVMFYQARWQIFLDPIYLDKYGENDIDLKKGNPLFLNAQAYAKLQRSWLDHSIGCIINESFQTNDFFV